MMKVKHVPDRIGYYLAGFADGEGSFNVTFRRRDDYGLPWKVSLSFGVSQREKVILALLKRHLSCGTLRRLKNGLWHYDVSSLDAIHENVIPFFERFPFLSERKKRDFSKFRKIAELVREGKHLTTGGIVEIVAVRREMNDGGRRRYCGTRIIDELEKRILRDYTSGSQDER